jgi:hypothetical protein
VQEPEAAEQRDLLASYLDTLAMRCNSFSALRRCCAPAKSSAAQTPSAEGAAA